MRERYVSRIGSFSTEKSQPQRAHAERPTDKHIISRTREGAILSYYGSDSWDFRAYRPAGYTGSVSVHFDQLPKSTIQDAKHIIFLILYYSTGARIKPSTVRTYYKGIRSISIFAVSVGVSMIDVFNQKVTFIKYLKTKPPKSTLAAVQAIQHHLLTIGPELSDVHGMNKQLISLTRIAIKKAGNYKQHPVIPNRLLLNLINDLDEFFRIWEIYKDDIYSLTRRMASNRSYGRQHVTQNRNGVKKKSFFPTFTEALRIHNLEKFSELFGITKSRDLSGFINRTQHAVQTIVSIYTGMRRSEVQKLVKGCLLDSKSDDEPIIVRGVTSKLYSQDLFAEWVSCQKIVRPIRIAEKLSGIILEFAKIPIDGSPLFPSVSYLGFTCAMPKPGSETKLSLALVKSTEIFPLFDENRYRITKADLVFLDCIDPLRDWEKESKFQLGQVWRFTNHQYRRSLAYYVAQSGLVSLPELKFQLKHITRKMTLYYAKSFSSPRGNIKYHNEFYDFMMDVKPEADTVAFYNNISQSDESVYGLGGREIVAPSNIMFGMDRSELSQSFKKGEIAYSETPLGACTTNEVCRKRRMIEISSCINCSSAIIKPSKLDRVILRQKHLVGECKRNSTDDFEYIVELAELKALEKYKNKLKKKDTL